MLTRRNARIKVMQLLFGRWQEDEISTDLLLKQLDKLFEQSHDLYLMCLFGVRETANYAVMHADIKRSKLLPTEDDKFFSTQLAECNAVSYLEKDESFNRWIKKRKLKAMWDESLPRRLFTELSKADIYKRYTDTNNKAKPTDSEVLLYLFREIMIQDEVFDQLIESFFPVWLDEVDVMVPLVTDTLQGLESHNFAKHDELYDKIIEIKSFAKDLLNKTVANREQTKALIAPKLENWDMDRVAVLDLLLMNMALTEIIDFPSIPIKVTMNEYIDLSKDYSTPRSREFINGVLDKIVKELKGSDRIYKTGRGLVDK